MFKLSALHAKVVIGLALIAILVTVLSLGVAAQDPPNVGPAGNGAVEDEEVLAAAAQPNAASYYKRYTADVFTPQFTSFVWQYDGLGCVFRVSGTGTTSHDLQLPDGAVVTYVRIYFKDLDPDDDAYVYLYAYDGQGGSDAIASAHSSGTPGWGSGGSVPFSHPVDNLNEALHLKLDYQSGTNDSLMICGVRVQYTYNLSTSSLPLVLNQSNE
ncbi:MAG TPA: hypothetical protein PKO09_17495 [Anaerolineae bacterium]|nr:hypothetical protein [Anaerolineae bacterium]